MPQQSDVPNGMIVTWRSVILEQLDSKNVSQLAAGRDVRAGFMIDHIGNFQRSAQQGLPIYRLTGGAGYVWAASWNQVGVGTLRFLTIDPSAIVSEGLTASTKVELPTSTDRNDSVSSEHAPISDAAEARIRDEQARIRDAAQARLEADLAKRAAEEETSSSIEYVRATRLTISDRLATVRDAEKKQQVAEISARLATANAEMPTADIKALRSEADSAKRILDDAEEFSRVTEIATLSDSSRASALKNLNDSYDNNRKTLHAMQFESP